MSPKLVYLHISKSAGTSFCAYLRRVYPHDLIWWYGEDSSAEIFEPEECRDAVVLGGHRPASFYPEGLPLLFLSVIRDPVDRAISLFNYYTTLPAKTHHSYKHREWLLANWINQGIVPGNMEKSIEQCDEFRREISNYQCSYLSVPGGTFEQAAQTIENSNYILGVFTELPLFHRYLQELFDWPVNQVFKLNTAPEGYREKFDTQKHTIELVRELNSDDLQLFDFVKNVHKGLYENCGDISKWKMPSIYKVPDADKAPDCPINWGRVHLYSKGIAKVNEDRIEMSFVISNRTAHLLSFVNEKHGSHKIGWQIKDRNGQLIPGAWGLISLEESVAADSVKTSRASISLAEVGGNPEGFGTVELSVVDSKGNWVNEIYPLCSCWATLFT